MLRTKFIACFVGILGLCTSVAYADSGVSYEGVTVHAITRTVSKFHRLLKHVQSKPKEVTVLKVKLSDQVQKVLQKNVFHANLSALHLKSLPSAVELGMNGVPVLDQGSHGTCATFALFAALDALSDKGDYYSQLCSLNLGNYLQKNGYSYSGWNGQDLDPILARIDEFGVVSKEQQRALGCGGMTEYPTHASDPSNEMSLEEFHALSVPGTDTGLSSWKTFFDITQWYTTEKPTQAVLNRTQMSLRDGNRILIGALLPLTSQYMGLVGKYHEQNDTWVLTPELEQEIKLSLNENSWGGHAMVITGYDDNAIAVDNEGRAHKGIFTLRNSWGSDVGDQGDFYMSYDYFNVLVIQLTELIKVQ